MKRRKIAQKTFIIGLLIAWIAVAFYGWKQTQTDTSDGLTEIVIGYQAGDEFDISKERGVLAKKMKVKGYKVVFREFQNGSAEMQALASGSIDYARIGDTPSVSALASGTNLTYVAAGGTKASGSGILVHKSSGISSVSDLKGKTIAYTKGTNSQYMILKILESAGLSQDDVNLVNLDQSAASVAYVDGTVDAWVNWDPATSKAEVTDNSTLLVTGSDVGVNNRSYIVSPTAFAEENEDVTELLIKYTSEDMTWANKHKDKLVTMLTESLGLEEAVVQKMVNRRTYAMTGMTEKSVSELQDIADLFYTDDIINNKVVIKDNVQYLSN
ncbi:aliphatic sulfonate ABC transporter substrate-binding protein [Streptococcus sp. HF-1907]|uniref:aliphatic sulfonate ABC transporter substrate-binding protein n=1 Tax=Streptococcus sp. HF-1907 TaxID=2785793 RepID=UPI00189E8BBD|nr:aliphatic sulfonate ABC transporter substrate-binding protein [Streptococcus sp. HF-1907]MBF7094433.1 aliphatic sulfonate ABC transporter substrate-binding protein [Streptococcus sp. HF-1907]